MPRSAPPPNARLVPQRRLWAGRAWHLAARTAAQVHQHPHVVTCVGITIVFVAVAYATSVHIGVPIRDPEGTLLGRRMVSPVLLMVIFAFLDSMRRALRMKRGGAEGRLLPLAWATFRERWWWRRLTLAVIGFLSFAFTYLAYRNLKSFNQLINYRSYDPELLALDRWMALGEDPARVLHDVLGTGVSAHVLSWVYLVYIPLVPITVSAALAFTERMREAYVFVAAYMWCWILGTASYYAIPTLGPFASRPQMFEALPSTPVERLQGALARHRLDLYSDNIGEDVVGGIAGFASLHVGIVVACWLMLRHYRQYALSWLAFLFLIPTILATVYFGWHFLIDDVAGFFIGWWSVLLGRVTVYPRLLAIWKRRARRATHAAVGTVPGVR